MWPHNCPVDGEMEVGDGEPCNWCGETEKPEPTEPKETALLTN